MDGTCVSEEQTRRRKTAGTPTWSTPRLSIKNIPSDLIEKFTGLPHLFSQAIGPLFSLDINSQYLNELLKTFLFSFFVA